MTDAQRALEELLKQQEDLAAKIETQRKASREEALHTVRNLCKAHEFSATDLKGCLKVSRARSSGTTRKRSTRKK